MSSLRGNSSGFALDENGVLQIVPMIRTEKPRSATRKQIPLERLVLTPSDLEDLYETQTKKRKVDLSVRKELFKIPTKPKPTVPLSSLNNKRSSISKNRPTFNTTTRSNNNHRNHATKKVPVTKPSASPLLDLEKTNEFRQPLIHLTNFDGAPKKTPVKSASRSTVKTPNSLESDLEFLQMEKNVENARSSDSPMSAVCNLLENTNLRSAKKAAPTPLEEIKQLLSQDQDRFKEYERLRRITMDKVEQLVDKLEGSRETQSRRSVRLAQKQPVGQEAKIVVSPAISKSVDLRKSTLNRNLSNNIKYDVQSPRLKRAVDMYNTFRTDCSILCTPKLDRKGLDSPQASVKRCLSRKLQQQCLMLQDSPKPN